MQKGQKMSEKSRELMRQVTKKENLSEETILKKRNAQLGKKHSKETKDKIREASKKENLSEETRLRKRESRKRQIFTLETRKKMSESRMGRSVSYETRLKIAETKRGARSHFWKGGASLQLYNREWTKILRENIRKRDNYQCKICNIQQNKHKLDIHHIDYDKNNCSVNNLVTLCRKCHMKTNFNRKIWLNYFLSI